MSTNTSTRIKRPILRNFAFGLWLMLAILAGYFYISNTPQFISDFNLAYVRHDFQTQSRLTEGVNVYIRADYREQRPDGSFIVTDADEDAPDDALQIGDRVLPPLPYRAGPPDSTVTLNVIRGDAPPNEQRVLRSFSMS